MPTSTVRAAPPPGRRFSWRAADASAATTSELSSRGSGCSLHLVSRGPHERARQRLAAETHLGPRPPISSDLSVCLVYPNTYAVGMANLGFHSIYDILVRANVAVERAFLPDDPRRERVRTLESGRAFSDFDIVAFSISFETDYVHVLDLLAGAGITLSRAARDDREPLVMAGGPAVFLNPEPLADFVDLFLIGEGEEMVPEWLDAVRGSRGGRARRLDASAAIDGAYRPDRWPSDPADRVGGARVRRRYVARLDDAPTQTRILAPEAVFGDMMLVEASRGCEWGCRFCAAGFMYRPVRHRSRASLRRSVLEDALPHRSTIGLVGAEMASQPGIASLCREIADRGGRASPSSLKADLVGPELAEALTRGRTNSVTVAPEAGSERLRRVINKNLTESEILRAATLLAAEGVRGLKLYSMIGLPTETDEDVVELVGLAARIRERLPGGVGRITLSINPFVPKPWTPLQWEPMTDLSTVRRRARLLSKETSSMPGVTVDLESPRDAYWQTLLSRGDRRVGAVLERVHEAGGRFWPVLRRANQEGGLGACPAPDHFVHRRYETDEPLPWDFIDHSVDKGYLVAEWRKALLERETPPCDVATCRTCGAC